MSFPESGHIKFQDDYRAIYEVEWNTLSSGNTRYLEFTTTIKNPSIPTINRDGYYLNKQLYIKGEYTIIRQIFEITESGYTILFEGTSHGNCDVPSNLKCENITKFKYYLDSYMSDDFIELIEIGPRFSETDDSDIIFADVDTDGSIIDDSGSIFEFVDAW